VSDKSNTGTLRQVTIHFRGNGSKHRAKPDGVHGCEIRWSLPDAPPGQVAR
jgi:hypothetical protein